MKVALHPWNNQRPIPTIPALVQSFIDGQFSSECSGFTAKVETDMHDTGHGMDYLNQLTVTKGEEFVYDSGMLKWRNGLPGSTDRRELHFCNVGLRIDGETLLMGVENGCSAILIYELKDGQKWRKESCDIGEVRRATEAAKIVPIDMPSLRKAFGNDIDSYWTVGSVDFETDFGPGFMVYHNGHSTDEVWDFIQVLVLHKGKPYISDRVITGLTWHGKFTTCGVIDRKVNGSHIDVTFWCAYHKNRGGNPKKVSFDLELQG